MSYLYFHNVSYDTDKIISIELDKTSIKISMLNERRHYHNYSIDNPEEAIRDYNQLMIEYNDAVAKRKSGEEKDDLKEMLRQNTEVHRRIESERNNAILSDKLSDEEPKKVQNVVIQETLF